MAVDVEEFLHLDAEDNRPHIYDIEARKKEGVAANIAIIKLVQEIKEAFKTSIPRILNETEQKVWDTAFQISEKAKQYAKIIIPENDCELTGGEEDAMFESKVKVAQKIIRALKTNTSAELTDTELEIWAIVLGIAEEARGYTNREKLVIRERRDCFQGVDLWDFQLIMPEDYLPEFVNMETIDDERIAGRMGEVEFAQEIEEILKDKEYYEMSDIERELFGIVCAVAKRNPKNPIRNREFSGREEDSMFLGRVKVAQEMIRVLKDKSFYRLSDEEQAVRSKVLEVVAEAEDYEIRGKYF